jgi:hypothetical protein
MIASSYSCSRLLRQLLLLSAFLLYLFCTAAGSRSLTGSNNNLLQWSGSVLGWQVSFTCSKPGEGGLHCTVRPLVRPEQLFVKTFFNRAAGGRTLHTQHSNSVLLADWCEQMLASHPAQSR